MLSLKDKDESQSSNSSNVHVNCRSESERKSCEEVQDSCEGKMRYKHTILSCQGDIPQPRWRHSATRIVLPDGSESVLIFGGRTSTCLALGDCYLLDIKSNTWTKVLLLLRLLLMYRRIAEFSWFSGLSQKQENRSLNECEILI